MALLFTDFIKLSKMSGCWVCDQKSEYRQNKLETARCEAAELSKLAGETIVIVKNGVLYKLFKLSEIKDLKVEEYINNADNSV